ncbi:hypothetical protein N9N67_02950 [Bacteriovoracaceae bacterium]|nr:hypothetical protein [Bacteriovoracaceae bacterium]
MKLLILIVFVISNISIYAQEGEVKSEEKVPADLPTLILDENTTLSVSLIEVEDELGINPYKKSDFVYTRESVISATKLGEEGGLGTNTYGNTLININLENSGSYSDYFEAGEDGKAKNSEGEAIDKFIYSKNAEIALQNERYFAFEENRKRRLARNQHRIGYYLNKLKNLDLSGEDDIIAIRKKMNAGSFSQDDLNVVYTFLTVKASIEIRDSIVVIIDRNGEEGKNIVDAIQPKSNPPNFGSQIKKASEPVSSNE